jgi:predicted nuclease with TOPRIM domain
MKKCLVFIILLGGVGYYFVDQNLWQLISLGKYNKTQSGYEQLNKKYEKLLSDHKIISSENNHLKENNKNLNQKIEQYKKGFSSMYD